MDYRIELLAARKGFDRKTSETCWAQSRAAMIPPGAEGNPSDRPLVLITTQPLLLSGSDVYSCLYQMRSDDLGRTWTAPKKCPPLARRNPRDKVEVAVCDFTAKWHAASGKLLGTGHTAWYFNNRLMPNRPRETAYSVYDAAAGTWAAWKTLAMPDDAKFQCAGAGCTQRIDLPGGDALLQSSKAIGSVFQQARLAHIRLQGHFSFVKVRKRGMGGRTSPSPVQSILDNHSCTEL